MPEIHDRNTALPDRFWDKPVEEDLITESGFKAKFKVSRGGGASTWQGSLAKVAFDIRFSDSKRLVKDIGVFIIEQIETQRSSPIATLSLKSLSKPLQKASARRVKQAGQWWENAPVSFIVNRLLESVYRDQDGQLPEDMTVNRQDLKTQALVGDMQYWNLGIPPNWDGQTFNPSEVDTITAMAHNSDKTRAYVAIGGIREDQQAELWEYQPNDDIWTQLGQVQEPGYAIHSLVFNSDQNQVFGAIWRDYARDEDEVEFDHTQWIAPDAKLFWWDVIAEPADAYLDDSNHSVEVPGFFPGRWDIREFFPMTPETEFFSNDNKQGHKKAYQASVGSFEASKHIEMGIPARSDQDLSHWPMIDEQNFENSFYGRGLTTFDQIETQGQLVPNTQNEQTDWVMGGDGAPQGFTITDGVSDVSIDNGQVSMIFQDGDFQPMFQLRFEELEPHGSTFRLKVEGFDADNRESEVALWVSLWIDGGDDIIELREIEGQNINGEHFFELPSSDDLNVTRELVISLQSVELLSDPINISLDNMSLGCAAHWQMDHQIPVKAGENIPITHFSKVIAALWANQSTNEGYNGPLWSFYDPEVGINPRDTIPQEQLNDISVVGTETVFACGDNGLIIMSTDQGLTWNLEDVDSNESVKVIQMLSVTEGWAGGTNGTLWYKDGGTWIRQQSPTSSDITGIHFFDSDNGVLISRGYRSDGVQDRGLWITNNGGASWSEQLQFEADPQYLNAFSTDLIYVVENVSFLYKITNNGQDVELLFNSRDFGFSNVIYDLFFLDEDHGWAVDRSGQVHYTTNGGDSWNTQTIDSDEILLSVFFEDQDHGIILSDSKAWRTTNGGSSWNEIDYPSEQESINKIDQIDGIWIAVGSNSAVYMSDDRGDSWDIRGGSFDKEEILLDFNLIAQSRVSLGDNAMGVNPFYGPDQSESGITPDNVARKTTAHNFNYRAKANKAHILDLAPSIDPFAPFAPDWLGKEGYRSEKEVFKTERAGNGYLSIQATAIGNRLARFEDNPSQVGSLKGLVRYTHNQQGLFALAQQANDGHGLIVFAVDASDHPSEDEDKFAYGPGGDSQYRFRIAIKAFDCETKQVIDLTNMDPWTGTGTNPNNPFNETGQTLYPTAGVGAGDKVYLAAQVASLYCDNVQGREMVANNRIVEIDLSSYNGSSWAPNVNMPYNSTRDQSTYNIQGAQGDSGSTFIGPVNDGYAQVSSQDPAGPVSKTRKICWLEHNPNRSGELIGWCFRKDQLLSTPAGGGLTPPCHEVFTFNPSDPNRLNIVDHDHQNGINADAIGFVGFTHQPDRTWYFRLASPTVSPSSYHALGGGVQANYYWDDPDGEPTGGLFWDDSSIVTKARKIGPGERFLSANLARTLANAGLDDPERDYGLYSSWSNYFSPLNLTRETWEEIFGNSSRVFFKLDSEGLDQRIELADFSDLKVWDAIAKICKAYNLVFGFHLDKFFMMPRSKTKQGPVLDADQGDIKDITKQADSDIRNVINVTPYRAQLEDAEWEVTHVEGIDQEGRPFLEDERLFEGEFSVNVKTHAQTSITLICTRRGRLITAQDDEDFEDPTPLVLGDARHHIWDDQFRQPPLFKFLVHNPVSTINLMSDLSSDSTTLYVNTLFEGAERPIRPGDIVLFNRRTDDEVANQVGRVIQQVDTRLNAITIEEPTGFSIEKFTSLNVARANLGSQKFDGDNRASDVGDWSQTFSDQGVAVVQEVKRGSLKALNSLKITSLRYQHIQANMAIVNIDTNKPHRLSKGDTFELKKAGDPDFPWNGHYEVFSIPGSRSIRLYVSVTGDMIVPQGFDVEDHLYIANDDFDIPELGTILRLNNISPFLGVRLRPYINERRHFAFLVTTMPSETLAIRDLPSVSFEASQVYDDPIGYVHRVNEDSMEIDLGPGDYQGFNPGDVINLHYILPPTPNTDQDNSPYMGLSQDLPNGLASIRWVAEPDQDLFNIGDIIRFNFEGMALKEQSSSIYTGVNDNSVSRWGEHPWDFPRNRFITHSMAAYWANTLLEEYGEPRYHLQVKLPVNPFIEFLSPGNDALNVITIKDRLMFPAISGFSLSGKINSISISPTRMSITLRTQERY